MKHTSRTRMQAIVVAAVLSVGAAHPKATPVGVRKAAAPPPPMQVDERGSARQRAHLAHEELALAFVPNAGQTDARVRFQAQAGAARFYFTPNEAVFAFTGEGKGHVLRLGFRGSDPQVEIEGARKGAATVNYLRGNDPARWHGGLSTYEEVVYRELWPGIDLAFRGEAGTLKYEFRLAPGSDPGDIRLAYQGAERLSLGAAGDLRIHTPLGVLADSPPVSYQVVGGARVPVESRYALAGGGYHFALGRYDPRRPLVIDPGLAYSTYLGGSGSDLGFGIAVDNAGNAYVTGETRSADFPVTAGAFDESFFIGNNPDVFVTKLGPSGSLLYSTYLGGYDWDIGRGIAVDAGGNAYVTGYTYSADFPTTAGAFDTSYNGSQDVFVTKLGPSGGAPLLYSTYLGGSGNDGGLGIAVDGLGNAYVTGATSSVSFPTTVGAFDPSLNSETDAFVTKVGPSGSAPLLYSTYLGGSSSDIGAGIAVDGHGNAYLTGQTFSTNFPTTPGAFDETANGTASAFVTKLGPSGAAPLLYSTYLGPGNMGSGIAVDGAGNAYVTGSAQAGFPTTPGAFDESYNGIDDAFLTKLAPSGAAPLLYSTYLGGSGGDQSWGIAVDGLGNAYVTGITFSADFPTTAGTFDASLDGSADVFVTKLGPSGTPLLYSTYLGGSGFDQGLGVAVDGLGNAYVTGRTFSADFPTTAGAFDESENGFEDAFVTKLDLIPPVPATLALSPAADTNPVGTSHAVTATVADMDGNPVADVTVRFAVAGSVSASGSCTTEASGQCDFTYQGPDFPGADVITAYADTNGSGMQDAGEPGAEAAKTWMLPTEGQVQGAGQLRGASGEKITFGFHARSTLSGSEGGCHFDRHVGGPNDKVECLNVAAIIVVGNMAMIYGDAIHNGQPTTYQITATENDKPTPDEVTVTTASGFSAGGPLEHGTVEVKN